ncbi:hypothetical protein [Komarekiella delphini-convector]|uniref:hypothetical protein n=1 Tax=Komarekiella delphini-convector TaxID=3050158 RepID=UPI001CD8FB1A|nr:hypothetical protein [Komarekiella delphini-convector]
MKSNKKGIMNFWERGDRVLALASGGAFLGVLAAGIPGAIIGGLLVSIYAYVVTK